MGQKIMYLGKSVESSSKIVYFLAVSHTSTAMNVLVSKGRIY